MWRRVGLTFTLALPVVEDEKETCGYNWKYADLILKVGGGWGGLEADDLALYKNTVAKSNEV